MTGFIGVLMLDTAFERILGDAGNPQSYHIPAKTVVVRNAGSTEIVRNGKPYPILLSAFCAAARRLEEEGAIALTSTCGFLMTAQAEIARHVRLPVMLSALSLFPLVRATHGNRRVGIITASSAQLGSEVLNAAGIMPEQAIITGMQDVWAFRSAILVPKSQQPETIDQSAIQSAVVDKALDLCRSEPDLAAILLECGNLPPYAQAIKAATGKPVYSILDGVRLLVNGSNVRTFSHDQRRWDRKRTAKRW